MVGGRVSEGNGFYIYVFTTIFEQVHFVLYSGLLFVFVVKLLVSFCKVENIVIYLFIHIIQLTITVSNLHPFFLFVFSQLAV